MGQDGYDEYDTFPTEEHEIEPAEAIVEEDYESIANEEDINIIDNGRIDSSYVSKTSIIPQDLTQQYNDNDFNYFEQKDKSILDKLKDWIIQKLIQIFSLKETATIGKWVNVIMYIIIGAVLLLIIYFIIKVIVNKEGRGVVKKKAGSIDDVDELAAAYEGGNFSNLIQKAKSQQDYRSAVRYYFIWLLKHLDERNVIKFKAEKPAMDYRYEIKSSDIRRQYEYAAYVFNYVWYGEFEIKQQEFEQVEQIFKRMMTS